MKRTTEGTCRSGCVSCSPSYLILRVLVEEGGQQDQKVVGHLPNVRRVSVLRVHVTKPGPDRVVNEQYA